MLRIGVWFDPRHAAYGGPTTVLLGTVLGLYQHAAAAGKDILILLNEPGDVNWSVDRGIDMYNNCWKARNMWHGPATFSHTDAEVEDRLESDTWKVCRRGLFPSSWFYNWVCAGLPYNNQDVAGDRQHAIWPAGVNTHYFCPDSSRAKTQDYFIYFKSQEGAELMKVLKYLFDHYFGLRGTTLTYYNYDAAMLRDAALSSKFCIMLDRTETQGLAALEIMACGCPLFVIDRTVYNGTKIGIQGATSVTCWDTCCGYKSSFENLETEFPQFISNLESYNPRRFVEANYSFEAAAGRLLEILCRA
jgi:hypothetical protein